MSLLVRNVQLTLGGAAVIEDVSTTISTGAVTALVGPNGAGKSTLLRCLSGELLPDKGEATLDNKPLSDWSPQALAQSRVALGQQSRLSFPLKVEQVVMLGRSPYRADRDQDRQVCSEAMRTFEIESYAKRPYPDLSGGEMQRVQLARIWAQLAGDSAREIEPRYLLLDEPLKALDISHQLLVMRTLVAVSRSRLLGVVIVLHDLSLAARFADVVLCLNRGKQVAEGAPKEILTVARLRDVYGVSARIFSAPDQDEIGVFVPD